MSTSNLLEILNKQISDAINYVGIKSFQIYNLEKIGDIELIYNINILDDTLISKNICSDLQRYLETIWDGQMFTGAKGKYFFYFSEYGSIVFNITKDKIILTINILFDLQL